LAVARRFELGTVEGVQEVFFATGSAPGLAFISKEATVIRILDIHTRLGHVHSLHLDIALIDQSN